MRLTKFTQKAKKEYLARMMRRSILNTLTLYYNQIVGIDNDLANDLLKVITKHKRKMERDIQSGKELLDNRI